MIGSELSEPFTYAARAVIEQQSAVVHEQDSVCYGKDLLEPMLDKYDRKTELAVQSAPVSYTHLDVYKRQFIIIIGLRIL